MSRKRGPLERRERHCVDCGEPISVPINQEGRMKRCARCQADYEAAQDYQYPSHYQRSPNKYIGGAYRIVRDPCGSWTPHGSLDLGALRKLAQNGWLDTGMRWSNDRRILEVQGNTLRAIETINRSPSNIGEP